MVVDLVAAELDAVQERIAGRFGRAEPGARVREYVSGLVAGLERKNGWTLAERAGEVSPDGMQRLLRRADWDVEGVRDDIRDYVIEHLGDRDGVLHHGQRRAARRCADRRRAGPVLAADLGGNRGARPARVPCHGGTALSRESPAAFLHELVLNASVWLAQDAVEVDRFAGE